MIRFVTILILILGLFYLVFDILDERRSNYYRMYLNEKDKNNNTVSVYEDLVLTAFQLKEANEYKYEFSFDELLGDPKIFSTSSSDIADNLILTIESLMRKGYVKRNFLNKKYMLTEDGRNYQT